MRFRVLLTVSWCLCSCLCLSLGGCSGADRSGPASATPPPAAAVSGPVPALAQHRTGLRQALVVLHGWDERRARAWARQDESALRRLYLPGSEAAVADVALLRAYTRRGLVVRRLVTQVLDAVLLHRGERRLHLRVRERVAGGLVAAEDGTRPLGSSRPVVREVALRRTEGRWKVGEVSGSGRAPRGGSR
jgi:hypothetical protein